jgi:hypothetical protein
MATLKPATSRRYTGNCQLCVSKSVLICTGCSACFACKHGDCCSCKRCNECCKCGHDCRECNVYKTIANVHTWRETRDKDTYLKNHAEAVRVGNAYHTDVRSHKTEVRSEGHCTNCNGHEPLCAGCEQCSECCSGYCCECGKCDDCCGCGHDCAHCRDDNDNEENMNKTEAAMNAVKNETVEATYRILAMQFVKLMRAPLLAALKRNKAPGAFLAGLEKFLETDLGLSAYSYLLGVSLSSIPWFSESPKAQQIAKELRVNGMAFAGTIGIEALKDQFADLFQMMASFINEAPALPGVVDKVVELPTSGAVGVKVTSKTKVRGKEKSL